jgi:hypothetical protein
MASDKVVRLEAELVEAAADTGRRERRSARQQLEHWARIGQAFCAHESATRRHIEAAVRGDLPISELSEEERLVANTELDVAIRERAAAAEFGQERLDAGLSAVAVDESGNLVRFYPDGRHEPLEDAAPALLG